MTKVNSNRNQCGKSNPSYKHGGCGTRLYRIWMRMHSRCNNSKVIQYADYGGRGITVCTEWDNFIVFRNWALANGYSDVLTIERKDNDLGYYPENCVWATRGQQANNKRLQQRSKTGLAGITIRTNGNLNARIRHEGEIVFDKTYKTIQEAVQARNDYIVANGLPHKLQPIGETIWLNEVKN